MTKRVNLSGADDKIGDSQSWALRRAKTFGSGFGSNELLFGTTLLLYLTIGKEKEITLSSMSKETARLPTSFTVKSWMPVLDLSS